MALRYIRNCIAIAAVTAYVGLAVGGHALHDVTCDHDHSPLAAVTSATDAPTAGPEPHAHHHHHGHCHHSDCAESSPKPASHGDHHHPSPPRHDHDCLICQFAAMSIAVVAEAVELPEAVCDPTTVSAVEPFETIYQPFAGNPRAPPA